MGESWPKNDIAAACIESKCVMTRNICLPSEMISNGSVQKESTDYIVLRKVPDFILPFRDHRDLVRDQLY